MGTEEMKPMAYHQHDEGSTSSQSNHTAVIPLHKVCILTFSANLLLPLPGLVHSLSSLFCVLHLHQSKFLTLLWVNVGFQFYFSNTLF